MLKAEGDRFIRRVFGVGRPNGRFPFTTVGHYGDRAELFALPHPYFAKVVP